jgi:hypothetical protein
MKKGFVFLIVLVWFQAGWSQSTFTIYSFDTTPEMDEAVTFSTEIWGEYLNSDIPIKMNVYYQNFLLPTILGVTIPNFVADFEGAPVAETNYVTSLANSISSDDNNIDQVDMDIHINSAANYYFGTDGNCPADQYDFVSVFLHEMCHGLGIVSVSLMEQNVGSFGMIEPYDLLPLITSFPFEAGDLQGYPSILDRYIVNGEGLSLTDPDEFDNPSVYLGYEFTGNDLWFTGDLAVAANDGDYPKIYAPTSWEDGSSMHHLNNSSFPLSSGNSMMTPFIGQGNVEQDPGPILLGMLEDIGWSVNGPVSVAEAEISRPTLKIYPNPSNGRCIVSIPSFWNEAEVAFSLYDTSGRCVFNELHTPVADRFEVEIPATVNRGFYSYHVSTKNYAGSGLLGVDR